MPSFEIGATLEQTVVVEDEFAIKFLGPSGARVLATPRMIGLMERTCRDLVLGMLDEGQDTVGTHVNVYHRKAAPMGASVRFSAELTSVNRRRVNFNVKATMGNVVIGEGTHERAIIEVRLFAKG
jgi:predicted thioesterase